MTSPILRHLDPPPSKDAPSGQRIWWIRQAVRLYAQDLAAWSLAGVDDGDTGAGCMADVLMAGIGLAREIGAAREEGVAAARHEWQRGTQRAQNFLRVLRARLWPLGRMKAPGERILSEARTLNDNYGHVLPTELLNEEARRIAYAAELKGKPRYGRQFAR